MKTTNKEVKKAIRQHINEIIHTEGYDMEPTAENVLNIFKSEYGREIKRQGEQYAFMEWLAGVPSALGIEIYHDDVKEKLNNFGINPTGKKYTNEQSWNLYRYLIYRELKAMAAEPHKQSEKLLKKIEKSFK